MKQKFKPFLRKRRGLTLVEVVAGLALLGSLLVGLLVTQISLARQRNEAETRINAVNLCDQLLATWQAEGKKVPHRASGRAGVNDRFRWNTRVVRTERFETITAEVVRLEMTDSSERNPKMIASVEVLAP